MSTHMKQNTGIILSIMTAGLLDAGATPSPEDGVLAGSGDAGTSPLALMADPGEVGSSFFFEDFLFTGVLTGTPLDGQTGWVDLYFEDDKFAVAGRFNISLSINQSDAMGVWPTDFSEVTAYLLDPEGNPSSDPLSLVHTGTMPTQVWPGWGYYLPDGTEYLPATTIYSHDLPGSAVNPQPDGSFYLEPIAFSGVRFEISYPETPGISAMGLRVSLANYSDNIEGSWLNPIHVSPEQVPLFYVPEPTSVGLVTLGALALSIVKRGAKRATTREAERGNLNKPPAA